MMVVSATRLVEFNPCVTKALPGGNNYPSTKLWLTGFVIIMSSVRLSVRPHFDVTLISWGRKGNELGSSSVVCSYLSRRSCWGLYMGHLDLLSRSQRSTVWISSCTRRYPNILKRKWASIIKCGVGTSNRQAAWNCIWVTLTYFSRSQRSILLIVSCIRCYHDIL
jgi:hypothetical protein